MEKAQRGFSLVELMVASSIGVLVILAMTSLFKMGMDTTFTVTQRAETQQNMRAAVELMSKDISLAGAGLPSGGVQLPTAAPSLYGCDKFGTCYVVANAYPNSPSGNPNYMYGILPGFTNGVQGGGVIPNTPGRNDSITSIYCDYNFPLTNFTFNVTSPTTVTVGLIAAPDPTLPNNVTQSGGFDPTGGDLLLFTVAIPGNGQGDVNGNSLVQQAAVVAEVTSITNGGKTLNFAAGDALNFNQAAGGNNLAAVSAAVANAVAANKFVTSTVCRLYAVTYFLQVPPAGGTVQTPRLMRQVSGFQPVPVADNIVNVQFTYDVINAITKTIDANQKDPIGVAESPGAIQKINMWAMGESLTQGGNKSQNMYLATSVSARNMSFCNAFGTTNTNCR